MGLKSRIAARKRANPGHSLQRFPISAQELAITAAPDPFPWISLQPNVVMYGTAAEECRMGGTSDGVAARGFVNGYSKRKTRVFSIIFRCRFFERTSHIVDIRCAQRGVPPLAARPSPEKFFIVSMIIAMRKRITPSGTMLCACILKAATCWRCRLTNTSNGHEV